MDPLQSQLTLSAVVWQEFEVSPVEVSPLTALRETLGSGPTLTSPVQSVLVYR